MSDFFRSAAMGILSRTLQSLLYKYLSEVDVDVVALPSLYTTEESQKNGWGVRLSNVRLREGTKLIDLPGQMTNPEDRSSQSRRENEPSENGSKSDGFAESVKGQKGLKCTGCEQHVGTSVSAGTGGRRKSSWFSWGRGPKTSGIHDDQDGVVASDPTSNRTVEFERYKLEKVHLAESSPEEEETSSKMALFIGKGGRIGILDIRIVSRTAHIQIEDAILTLEVARAPSSGIEVTDEAVPPHSASGESGSDVKVDNPNTETDRDIAESALARVLSSLPNLLIRDTRIRLILRSPKTSTLNIEQDTIGIDDRVVDFYVEMLSITDGEDFLASFLQSQGRRGEDEAFQEPFPQIPPKEPDDGTSFETKRIRTGKGSGGGLTIRMYSGGDFRERSGLPQDQGIRWARQRWLDCASDHVVRLSGLDLEARLFVEEKEEVLPIEANNTIYDDIDMDSMLFGGVDYIAPGPQTPFSTSLGKDFDDENDDLTWAIPGASTYTTDENGIQRCGIKSSFHRVARGLVSDIFVLFRIVGVTCLYNHDSQPCKPDALSVSPWSPSLRVLCSLLEGGTGCTDVSSI